MEVLRPFRYWTLWISQRHKVMLHHVITLYNDMLDPMDGVMWALAKKNTPWKADLYFAVMLVQQKLSQWYAEVTPMTGMILYSTHIPYPCHKMWSFWMLDKGIDKNPEAKTSYTIQYQEQFAQYMENEYCPKHWRVPDIQPDSVPSNNLFPSAMASGCSPSSFDPDDFSSDDKIFSTPNYVAETTPRPSNRAPCILTTARLYWNSLAESPKNWGRVNPNLDDYHSNPIEIGSTFWILDITDWWRKREEMHSIYADLSNVAQDIFSIIPHGVRVEASFSLGWHVISWR